MARICNLKNKLFRLDIERWRDKRRTGRHLRYYLNPVLDERNALARSIDFFGPLLMVLGVSLILIWSYSGELMKTAVIFTAVMLFEIYIALKLRNYFSRNATVHQALWSAGAQCQQNIKKIKTVPKLENLAIEILERIDGFHDVHKIVGTDKKKGEGITLRALLYGAPVAVGCLLPEASNGKIPADPVITFRKNLANLGLKAGVLITSGFFSVEARRAAVEGRRQSKVMLLDLYWLVELARETGHNIFPIPSQDQESTQKKKAKAYPHLLRKVLARDKAKGYLLAAIIMLVMVSLADDGLMVGYAVFSAINAILSVYCLWSNRENQLIHSVRTR